MCFWVYISICVQMNEMWGAILARHNHQHQPDNHLLFVFISRHYIAHIFGMKRKTLSLFQRKMEIWWEKEQKNFFHILIYTFEDPFQKIAFILSSLLQAQSTHLKLKVVRIDDKKWIDKCSTRDSRIESETCEKCKIKPNPHLMHTIQASEMHSTFGASFVHIYESKMWDKSQENSINARNSIHGKAFMGFSPLSRIFTWKFTCFGFFFHFITWLTTQSNLERVEGTEAKMLWSRF